MPEKKIKFNESYIAKLRSYFLLPALFFCLLFFTVAPAFSANEASTSSNDPITISYTQDLCNTGQCVQVVSSTTDSLLKNGHNHVSTKNHLCINDFVPKEVIPPVVENFLAIHKQNLKKDYKNSLSNSREVLYNAIYNVYKTSDSTNVAVTCFDGTAGFLIHKQLNTNA